MTELTMEALARQALQNGSLVPLLRGEGLQMTDRFLPVSVPVDEVAVLEEGLYPICTEENRAQLSRLLQSAVLALLRGTAVDAYLGYNACWTQLYHEKEQDAPFAVCDDRFLSEVRQALARQKSALLSCRAYQGAGRPRGLWGFMEGSNQVLREDYGVTLL